jgi:Zn-dependent M28 family amino/carboxypeptidase
MTDEKIVINAHRDGYYEAANDNATGVATLIGLAEYFAKIPKAKRRRTLIFVGNPGHHNTAVGSQYLVEHKDEFFSKAALLINCEHTAQVRTDLYGYRLVATNDPWGFNLFIGGGPALGPIVQKDLATFGVSHYKELDPSPAGDIGQTYKLAPSLQLIMATHYYHSDRDTYETIPANGLEDVTRAYAKIIDDVNKVDLKDLVWPSAPARSDLGGGNAMLLNGGDR